MATKFVTLAQSQTIANGVIAKVKAKGYALNSDLTALSGRVATLIGNETGDNSKSARNIAAEEVAKVVAEAPTSFDTLKEIADWIQSDTTGAAKMANDIDALKTKTVLGTHVVEGVQTEYGSVKDYVEDYVQEQSYEHPAYTPTTGAEDSNQTPAFGGTFNVSQVVSDATGHITGQTTRTVTIPSATAVASVEGAGGSNGLMTAAQAEKLAGIETASAQDIADLVAALDNL